MWAIDIDDTLSETASRVFELVHKELGHEMSVEMLLSTYRQPGSVPEWQHAAGERLISGMLSDEEFLKTLQTVDGARDGVEALHSQDDIVYITSRLDDWQELTEAWLREHQFARAEVICRPDHERRTTWKLSWLEDRFENVRLIDDSLYHYADAFSSSGVEGWWFNRYGERADAKEMVREVGSWEEIIAITKNSDVY